MDINKKNFIWNIVGTTLSSFNSLFFMIIVTRINGVDKAGIFSFGFSFACLFYIIGIYSGRVFQVTDNDENNDSFSYINSRIISCLIMFSLALLFCMIRGYSLYKFIVVILLISYKMLEAFSETLYAIIQIQNNLYKVGISLFLKAIISLILFFIIDIISKNMIISIVSIIIVNIIFIIFYDFKNTKLKFKEYSFNRRKIKKIFKIGFWTFTFTFLNLYLINLSKYIIDFISSDSIQTIFSILIMPATVVSMFAQFIIHPMLLKIKTYIKNRDYKRLIKLVRNLTLIIIIFGIMSIIGLYILGIPVLNFVYGINLEKYKNSIMIVLLGATFYSVANIYSNVLTAYRKTISQTVIYIIISIICTFISILLIKSFLIEGAIYSYLVSMILLFTSFLILFCKVIFLELKKEKKL